MENFAGADLHKTVDRHMSFGWSSSRLTERRLAALWYWIRWPLWFEGWTGRLDLFQAPDFLLPPVMSSMRNIVAIHAIKALAVVKIQSSMDHVSEPMGSLILQ